jgi:hypothetical protein
MDAGGFDVFHDAGHVHVLTVGQSVHVHFDGVLEELVDEDGMFGRVSADHIVEVFFHIFRTALKIRTQTQTRIPAKALRTAGSSEKPLMKAAMMVMMTSEGNTTPSAQA